MGKCVLKVVFVFPKSNNIGVILQDKAFATDPFPVYQGAKLRP
jgi:hypothetical protein